MPYDHTSGMSRPEFEEFAQMKADINSLKLDVSSIKCDIRDFIVSADGKYARKEELKEIRAQLSKTSDKLTDIIFKVGTTSGMVLILLKMNGVL